ncbi:peptidoglycan-binding protein [Halomonas sp. DN3]|uniref:Peptidoglycan-binding protein n=1 Tax=Halomonas sp. RT37 TaxID=2950872 RepID=A0AAU7KIJ4_9GAMM|nr:peptidoglycan-binding protein [Halomonas sp. DN3]USZ50245.1 peptidoglycan-binding protein [Halomonas sp. DN3]
MAEQTVLVQDDHLQGVVSVVYSGSEENPKGETDHRGMLQLEKICEPQVVFIARPSSPFYETGKARCLQEMEVLTIRVTAKPFYSNLLINRDNFLESGDYAAAALASNEIAARTTDAESSHEERIKAIESFARYLELTEAASAVSFDERQGARVASDDFVEALRHYQEREGLPASGQLDYQTLRQAAELDTGTILFEVLE